MPYRVINMMITDVMGSVTDGTISMIQSANEPVRKQLINRYCGRLSTWEASWLRILTEGQSVHEAHDAHHGHWLSPAPVLSAFALVPGSNSDKAPDDSSNKTLDSNSDRNSRSVSAINKVLERYNLVRKKRLH